MALTNSQMLAEARDALHKLNTGQAVTVFLDQNGERVEFNRVNIARLEAYITKLEGLTGASLVSRGAIGFFF